MNDRQADELTALQAIFPDAVSWELSDDATVKLTLKFPVEFEDDNVVYVWDLDSDQAPDGRPNEPTQPEQEAVEAVATQLAAARVDEQRAQLGRSAELRSGKGARRRRGKGRGGASAAPALQQPHRQSRDQLSPVASPLQSRTPVRLRTVSANPPLATPAPGTTPLPAKPPSSPPTSAKSSRIRFVPRPPLLPVPTPSTSTSASASRPSASSNPQPKRLNLRYFPPLTLTLELSPNYPETVGPSKVELSAESDWLSESSRRAAERKLCEVYIGDECLFSIADLLTSSSPDFLSTLSLCFPLVLHQSAPTFPSSAPAPLSTTLQNFNAWSTSSAFDSSSHLCPLCFSPHRGSNCVRLASCGCTFCAPCLKDYFSLLITEGLVRSVACPSLECTERRAKWEKETPTAGKGDERERENEKPGRVDAEEVEKVCGEEVRKRWEWLKEKVRVESDPSISFCPRESCQAATPKMDDEEKLRVCPSCNFAFCVFCRKGWHGARNACSLPQSTAIVSQYLSASPDERQRLELRYGAANLKRLVAAYEEERALQEWLESNSTRCPGCDVPIEKSFGCNHVTCAKCQTHLCYRCGKSITPTDPYKHFNTPGGSCYGKLFDFVPGQEPGVEEWIGELVGEDAAH
ncbi:hypothetical protein JCM21900_004822 [Sporobolomyces salmonicolor]